MVSLSKKLEPKEDSIPKYLVVAQSLSSIAPLGSVSAYLTFAMTYSLASTGLSAILGSLVYLVWVIIGYRYSKVIASTGGTYEFAKQGGGELVGRIAGWLYWISYATYLSSVTTYLVSSVIPTFVGVSQTELSAIEVILPVLLFLLVISGVKPPLFYSLVTSSVEVLLIIALGVKVFALRGFSYSAFTLTVPTSNFFAGAMAVAFTLAGGGASFFLGYEAKGKGKTVSTSYLLAFSIAAVAVVFASFYEVAFVGYANAGVISLLNETQFPGYYISEQVLGFPFSAVFLAFTVNSLIGSAVAAYVALSRLTYTLVSRDMFRSVVIVFLFFFAWNLVGGITGQLLPLYYLTTEISLVTLFVSHLIVSAVYPLFSRRIKGISVVDVALATLGSATMAYGVYSNLFPLQLDSGIALGTTLAVSAIIALRKWAKVWGSSYSQGKKPDLKPNKG
ncbi:MAG: APC family permease [Candidatus Aramenus sp.]|nr:APC family permease [Candidatus Aramenus sp.]